MKKTKKSEVLFDYSKFNTETIRISPKRFMELPDYYRNRDVKLRIPKMVKRLELGPCPTHLRVAVGKVVKSFGGYRVGQLIKLDGHGRSETYKICPHFIPNVDLFADIYEVSTHDEALSIYNNIDSLDSVEKSNEKLTGLLRECGFNAKTETIRRGSFKTVFNHASRHCHDEDGLYLNDKKYNTKFHVKFYHFLEELKFIDDFIIDRMDRYSSCVFASLLLITKKYGTKNKRVKLLIENFRDDITEKLNGHHVDGVHYVYHVLYAEFGKELWKVNNNTHAPRIISHILYAFDMFMKNETISKKVKYPSDQELKKYFNNYLK